MDWTLQLKATMHGLTDAGEFRDVPPSRSVCVDHAVFTGHATHSHAAVRAQVPAQAVPSGSQGIVFETAGA